MEFGDRVSMIGVQDEVRGWGSGEMGREGERDDSGGRRDRG